MPKEANKKQDNKKQNKKSFGKDFKAELKRVIWPTPKQLFNNTVAVITVVLITAAIVFVLDFAFESMNKYGIEKLKEMVDNNNSEATNSVVLNETSTEESSENTVAEENANNVEE
jgi:preprotein translocase subunit SecE